MVVGGEIILLERSVAKLRVSFERQGWDVLAWWGEEEFSYW
jgi:hypothetical protein